MNGFFSSIGIAGLFFAALLGVSGCAHHSSEPVSTSLRPKVPEQRFEYTQPQMGVPFRIVLYAPNKLIGRLAAEAAYARIAQLNQVLSDYETDSELSELSQTAG